MILGYDILDIGNFHDCHHMKYCKECYNKSSEYLKHQIFDTLEEPFVCDGCKEDINERD